MKKILVMILLAMSIVSCRAMQEKQLVARCTVISSENVRDFPINFFIKKFYPMDRLSGYNRETILNFFLEYIWDEIIHGERMLLLMEAAHLCNGVEDTLENRYLGHISFAPCRGNRIQISSPGFNADPTFVLRVFLRIIRNWGNNPNELICCVASDNIHNFKKNFNQFGFIEDPSVATPNIGEKYKVDMTGYTWFKLPVSAVPIK